MSLVEGRSHYRLFGPAHPPPKDREGPDSSRPASSIRLRLRIVEAL